MKANFIDPKDNSGIYVSSYKIRFEKGKMRYFANGQELVNDEGQELTFNTDSSIEATTTIVGSERIGRSNEQYEKDVKYLKQRSKNHAKSADGRHMRAQAIEREYKSMGLEKK